MPVNHQVPAVYPLSITSHIPQRPLYKPKEYFTCKLVWSLANIVGGNRGEELTIFSHSGRAPGGPSIPCIWVYGKTVYHLELLTQSRSEFEESRVAEFGGQCPTVLANSPLVERNAADSPAARVVWLSPSPVWGGLSLVGGS